MNLTSATVLHGKSQLLIPTHSQVNPTGHAGGMRGVHLLTLAHSQVNPTISHSALILKLLLTLAHSQVNPTWIS